MAVSIDFPSDINGISEIGIAANVDEITDPSYYLKVCTVRVVDSQRVNLLGYCRLTKEAICPTVKAALESIDLTLVAEGADAIAGMIALCDENGAKKIKNAYPDVEKVEIALVVSSRDEFDVTKTLLVNPCPVSCPVSIKLWNSFVALTVGNGWFPNGGKYVQVLDVTESASATGKRTVEEVNQQGFFDMQMSATLIASTKVSWWLTNHHVGQADQKIESYAGKVFRAFETEASEPDARKVMWAAGKWNSTISWMRCFGIRGLKPSSNDDSVRPITMGGSEDITMRMSSRPAGAAEPTTYASIYSHVVRSVFSVLVPPVSDIAEIRSTIAQIEASPASYHMGAMYLTGSPRASYDPVDDSTKENLSGYIHAAAGSGTLAKAKVILPRSEIEGNVVYSTIISVKAQLAATASATASLAMVAALRGGGQGASVATVENKITLEAVKAAVDEAKAKESAAKERTAGGASATISTV